MTISDAISKIVINTLQLHCWSVWSIYETFFLSEQQNKAYQIDLVLLLAW